MTEATVDRLNTALEGRYAIEPELAAVVGAERFLAEIRSSTATSSQATS